MWYLSPLNLFALLFLAIIGKLVSNFVRKQKIKSKARRRGCLPPPSVRNNDWLGRQILKDSIQASKEDRGPQFIIEAMNKVGTNVHTVRLPVLDYELLVTRDPENVRALFQSADFDIGPYRSHSWMPLLGEGIFTARGEQWKHSRALVRPQFSRDQISSLELEERHSRELLASLPVNLDGWTEKVDLAPLFYHFTLDTATEFLYGESVDSQAAARINGHGVSFGKHLDFAKHYVDKRGALAKFYWLLNSKEFQYHCKQIHEHVDRIVEQRLQSGLPEKQDRFILLDELAKSTRNPRELRNETLHILTAARDPTAALLGWVFYFLARSPRVVDKLRSVILEEFGVAGDLDFAKLRSCTYLQYVINETLRISAVIAMNERVALRDTVLPRGGGPEGLQPIFVPKGNQVLIPKYAMQHRPDIWGEDAEEFNPERWEGRRIGPEFSPFGGGRRKCIGQQFGQTEAAYVIVRMLQIFDKIENLDPEPIRLHHAIENRSGTGVKVKLHRVQN